jgi:hypothetical protein
MSAPSAVLFNQETNTYEEVPAEQVSAAIASGKFTASGATTETQADGGVVTRPVEQLGAAATQGEREAGAVNAARAAAARREHQKELDSDAALTFAEGIGDALTVGLVHGTREEDELRREADSGSALLGQLAGTALGLALPVGPVKWVTKGGEALGGGIARTLLGEAETGFRGVVTAGLKESAANAALMAATAFGHQVTDAVLADKPFAGEAIANEAGMGALLGFGFGFGGSAFGQLAKGSRAAVEASGVALKESRAALDAVHDLTRGWDSAVEEHASRVGVLKVLSDDGHIPSDMHVDRSAALRQAERARDALREIDSEAALGGDKAEYQKWRNAVEKYQDAVTNLNERMTPSPLERAHANKVNLGESPNGAGAQVHPMDIDRFMADNGFRSPMADELNKAMTPEARAAYERIHGRPFEDLPGTKSVGETPVGEENLGGQKTPTSELGTNPGGRARRPAAEAPNTIVDHTNPTMELDNTRLNDTIVDPRLERFERSPARVKSPRDTVIEAEGRTVMPREVLEAGERPIPKAETGQDFVESTKRQFQLPEGRPTEPRGRAASSDGKKAVRDYLNGWFRDFDKSPRVGVADELHARLQQALDSIAKAGGSRLDSAGALELLKSMGLKNATSPLGLRLDQVWSLGQIGRFAADEARGVASPLRKGLMGRLQTYAAGRVGKAVGGALLGGSVGGPVGAILGMAAASAGFAGKAASTAGKLMTEVAKVGEALLKGRRATVAARAVAGNRPYQYDDQGPIKDPVERIIALQRLAGNPDLIRARVMKQVGDVSLTSPEMSQHMVQTVANQLQVIAKSAPAIMFTPLGKPVTPTGTALQKFYDMENAMHDLPGVLDAIAKGTASSTQLRALQLGFPAVHAELARGILPMREALEKLEEAKLRTIEKVLGMPLTRATADPKITARFQGNWTVDPGTPKPAQAFKIRADKPTAAQSASGDRAPGNERIAR